MGFNNDKRARKEMLSYLKLHRLHSTNIVSDIGIFIFVILFYLKINIFF